jgi:hypothetical protein
MGLLDRLLGRMKKATGGGDEPRSQTPAPSETAPTPSAPGGTGTPADRPTDEAPDREGPPA